MKGGKLIHIACSPRKTRSVSGRIAGKFIKAYKLSNPDSEVTTIDLWTLDMPEYDEFAINAKFKIFAGEDFSEEEQARWSVIEKLFNEFNSGDKYLLSVPMWNFSIPYKLKHYIDLITQPRLAFKVNKNGYTGMVTGKPAVIIYACGGCYTEPPYRDFDLQKPYMQEWLRFIGFKDLKEIRIDNTMASPEKRAKSIAEARKNAETFATAF
ncbi:MAG: NAD(P)H-dependent oxidoreductase [Victivallaceae bacterium]|jgi:FMN-dependent NADH-azoreductase